MSLRRHPAVAGDDRAWELAEELAVLAGDHPVLGVGDLGDVNDLEIGLLVLRRVEHEVEDVLGRHPGDERRSFAANHAGILSWVGKYRERRGGS